MRKNRQMIFLKTLLIFAIPKLSLWMTKMQPLKRRPHALHAEQQDRGGLEGHEECCLPQVRLPVLQGLEVQGVQGILDDRDGRERHCGRLARPRPQGPEIRRHRHCLADP